MCDGCGCSPSSPKITVLSTKKHVHATQHDVSAIGKKIQIEQDVLKKNKGIAARNRSFLQGKAILALNLVSSPGSGKTTILEHTVQAMKATHAISVIEGDQQTTRDAERINATGVDVVQINTGTGCHLDGEMVANAMQNLHLPERSILFIENVGNLVCPAMFDLGEAAKIVIISVTEGDDKPQKYPQMFHAASLCLINKIDLLPHVDFSIEKCKEYALQVNPQLHFFEVSATTGQNMAGWYDWLHEKLHGMQPPVAENTGKAF